MSLYTRVKLCAIALLCACTDDQLTPSEPELVRPRMVEYTASVSPAVVLSGYLNSTIAQAFAINDLGAIAGASGSTSRAAVWMTGTDSLPVSILPVVTGLAATAYDINAAGQLAGLLFDTNVRGYSATLWTPAIGGGYTVTSVGLPGAVLSHANALNDQGQVVGMSRFIVNGSLTHKCFLWTPSSANATTGTVEEVPGIGGQHCQAHDINSAGQIAGTSTTATSPGNHAFVRSNGVTTPLEPDAIESAAYAINNAGQVVGSRTPSGGLGRPAIWAPSGSSWLPASDILAPGSSSGQFSAAMDINDAGFVVYIVADGATTRAFFWNSGAVLELTSPDGTSTHATALSNVVQNRVIVAGHASQATGWNALRWTVHLAPVVTEGCGDQATRIIGEFVGAGYLTDGASRSLTAKLESASRQAAQGKTTAAANLLKALANEITALQQSGRLTSDQASQLNAPVTCVIDSL